jgi:hypothetical protein
MYLLAACIISALVIGVALHLLVLWLMFEPREDGSDLPPQRHWAGFYDPRNWTDIKRWLEAKPLRLTYRRDKSGRFRKLP